MTPISSIAVNALKCRQSVDSDHLSAVASAKEEGVPLAVAKRVFGQDPTCPGVAQRRRKPIIACPPEPWRRRKELNEVLVA